MNDTKKLREKIEEGIKPDIERCCNSHDCGETASFYGWNSALEWVLKLLDEEPTDKPEKLQRYVTVDLFAIATQIETLQDRVNWLLEHHEKRY